MKIFLLSIFVIVGFSACASHSDDAYYDRANIANDKAQADLNK